MSNPAFEAARLELSQRLAALRTIIVTQNNLLKQHVIEADRLEAELAAMDRARDLLLGESARPAAGRHNVQKPVMAALRRTKGNTWSEDELAQDTGLPVRSIHDFLLRAVRKGTVERTGDRFRIEMRLEAAE